MSARKLVRGSVLTFSRNVDDGRVEVSYPSGRAAIVSRAYWNACEPVPGAPITATAIHAAYAEGGAL